MKNRILFLNPIFVMFMIFGHLFSCQKNTPITVKETPVDQTETVKSEAKKPVNTNEQTTPLAPGKETEQSTPKKVPFTALTVKPVEIYRVNPEYPEELKGSDIAGNVIVKALVGVDGLVKSVKVLKALHPLLDQAAIDATFQFRFRPAEVDGQPVEINISIPFNFKPPK